MKQHKETSADVNSSAINLVGVAFVGRGCYSPNQYLLPKYVTGRYDLASGSPMLVCRGLARESTPLPRYFNSPEFLVVELRR